MTDTRGPTPPEHPTPLGANRTCSPKIIWAVVLFAYCSVAIQGFRSTYYGECTDFRVFYRAGSIVLRHPHPGALLYDEQAYAEVGVSAYYYPPVFAILVAPFAVPSFTTAAYLWLLANLGLLAGCIWITCALLPGGSQAAPLSALALLVSWPVRDILKWGQIDILLVFLLLFAILLHRRGQISLAMACLALLAWLKVWPVAFVVAALLLGRRGALYYLLWLLSIGVVGLVLGGYGATDECIRHVLPKLMSQPPYEMMAANQSLYSFLSQAFAGAQNAPLQMVSSAIAVAALAAAAVLARRRGYGLSRDISLVTCVALTGASLSWSRYAILLHPVLVTEYWAARGRRSWLILGGVLLAWLPLVKQGSVAGLLAFVGYPVLLAYAAIFTALLLPDDTDDAAPSQESASPG